MSNKILICGINILFINHNTFFVNKEIPSHGYHLWLQPFHGLHPPVVTPWFPPSHGYHAWLPPFVVSPDCGDAMIFTLPWLPCILTMWFPC